MEVFFYNRNKFLILEVTKVKETPGKQGFLLDPGPGTNHSQTPVFKERYLIKQGWVPGALSLKQKVFVLEGQRAAFG